MPGSTPPPPLSLSLLSPFLIEATRRCCPPVGSGFCVGNVCFATYLRSAISRHLDQVPSRFSVKTAGDRSMLLKIYSGLVLALDVATMLVRVLLSLLEALFLMLVPAAEKSLSGEVVLVTGTGHGIGRELAQQLAALGATVVCWDVNAETNRKTAEELVRRGHKAHAYTCDVSSREEVLRVAKQVQAEVGDVSVVVNNAGIMPCRPFLQHQAQEIRTIFDINVFAHFWVSSRLPSSGGLPSARL